MNRGARILVVAVACLSVPYLSQAQDSNWASSISSLTSVLDQIYADMLPLCSQLIGVGQGIAGFAALFYIATRVWGHIARAEPIDFYPLFRPFVIGFAIMIFPSTIALINGIMQPTVTATSAMVNNSDQAIAALLKQKQAAVQQTDAWQMYVGDNGEGNSDKWYKYTHPDDPDRTDEGWIAGIGDDIKFAMAKASYNFRNAIKEVIAEVLQLLFAAASLCIDTMRTFNLLLLAIVGPIVFGISVFDGLQHTLRHWLARYLNVFLWLPVANLFGAIIGQIQQNMLKIDIAQIGTTGDTFFSTTDAAYMIFMIIGIIGYTTVPGVANQLIHVSGDSLTQKTTKVFRSYFP
jgi:conjugative transposon TraJ protein